MNDSKVILVQPPIKDFYLTKKRTIPYGLASIAASLNKSGFCVEILDALATNKSKNIAYPEEFSFLKAFYGRKDQSLFSLFHQFRHFGYSHEYIAVQIRKKKPFIAGISSLFTAYAGEALKTAETIKKFYPECIVVMGGHHPTQFPEQTLAYKAVDFVIRGDGEEGMVHLCRNLKRNPDPENRRLLEKIPGIAFKKKDNSFYISPPSWINSLNSVPIPRFNLINHNFYQRKKRVSSLVVSSRGCPMKCSYCSVSSLSSYAPFRQRSIENVINEIIQQLENQNIGFIDFEDENLCLNKEWFLSLFSKIGELTEGRDIELRAMNGLYPPAIDEDILQTMKRSGFKILNLSLGSTVKKELDRFNRRDVRQSFKKVLESAGKHKLSCVSYIIAAAPGQDPQNSLDDLLYLARKRTLIGLSIYYPAPGSADYQLYENQNILPAHFSLMRSSAFPFDDKTTRIQAVTLLRLSRIINFMKYLKDTGDVVPSPEPFTPEQIKTDDRKKISKRVLQWFLYDGVIRGVDSDGRTYPHTVDKGLTQQFITRIRNIELEGSIKR